MLDIVIYILIGMLAVGMAVLGGHLASKKPGHRLAFYAMGVVSVVLIAIHGYRARNVSEDLGVIKEGVSNIQETINELASPQVTNRPAEIDQARLRMFNFELLPLTPGRRVQLNVFVQNVGKVKAEMRAFSVVYIFVHTNDVSKQVKRENLMYEHLKKIIKTKASKHPHEVPPRKGIWYTDSGPPLSKDLIEKLNQGTYIVYFLGAIKYWDADGTRYTTYCQFTHGNPKVMFLCHKYTDENIQQLAE